MQAVATNEARHKVIERPDGVGARRDYFGTSGSIDTNPQAFLVELPYAGATVHPHFHDIDQFQVVVEGGGRIGKKPLAPITFQYADAYTPYGPIVASDDGLSFFTLRNVASGGHFTMPGSRHLMPCRAGRNIAGTFELAGASDAAPITQSTSETLMTPQDDGVSAVGLRIAANELVAGPPSDAGGQYYLVCSGTLIDEAGKSLPRLSVLRVDAGEAATPLQAGSAGAEVLVLQFARPSQRPGSNPAELSQRDTTSYVQKTVRKRKSS